MQADGWHGAGGLEPVVNLTLLDTAFVLVMTSMLITTVASDALAVVLRAFVALGQATVLFLLLAGAA